MRFFARSLAIACLLAGFAIVNAVPVAAQTLGFSKAFSPATITPGGTSMLTYTIAGPGGGDFFDIAFTDNLSDFLGGATPTVTDLPQQGFCGFGSSASASVSNGELILSVTGATLTGDDSRCELVVAFTVPADLLPGDYGSTTSDLSAMQGLIEPQSVTSAAAEATLTVSPPAAAPGFAKAFSPDRVDPGEVSTLTFTIDNSQANAIDVGSLAFTDAFPDGMVVAGTPDAATTCGGTFAPAASAISLDFSGGSVAAGESCTLSVAVQALRAVTLENVSDELTSDLPVDVPGASATLEVDEAPLSVSMSFSPSTIGQGGVSRLTYELRNGAAVAATLILLSDTLPDNVVLADPSDAQTTCTGGTLTAAAGGSEVSYSDDGEVGSLPSDSACTIAVNVTSTVAGSYTNNTESVISSLGTSAPAEAMLTVNPAVAPGFARVFSPDTIGQGRETEIVFTIDNGANAIALTGMGFDDSLPSGVSVADTPVADNSCGGTFSPVAGATRLVFSAGGLDAGATCELRVRVRALAAGTLTDPAVALTSSVATATAPSATLTVNPAAAPGFARVFSPDTIGQGRETEIVFTIDNGANAIALTGMGFDDSLPSGVSVADTPAADNSCGGTFSPVAGATRLVFSAGGLDAGATCELRVRVRALAAGTLTDPAVALTSSVATATAPSATLTVNPAVAPGFARVFSPDTIGQGRETEIVFTIDNGANAIALTGMGFDDSLPSGVSVADTPAADNSCGGTFSPVAGATRLVFSAGGLDAGATCELRVRVRALAAGTLTDPAVALTSSVATATAPSATLTVNPAAAPGFARVFSPDTIGQGRETEIVFTIDNGANAIALTGMGFDDSLPSGVSVADTPAAGNSCGGTFSPVAGATRLVFSAGGLDAGATCELRVRVRALAAGTLTDPAVALTSSVATATAPSATLTVNPAAAPGFAKAFSPARVDPGGVSTLTFTIDNEANAIAVGSLAFTDAFPDGMVVAGTPNGSTTCGGTFAPAASAPSLAFSGGSVAAGRSCTLSVAVQALRAGTLENVSGGLTSDLPVAAPPRASATLTVNPAAAPGFAKAFSPARVDPGGVSTLTFTIDNGANLIDVGGLAFTDAFPEGMVVAGTPNAATTCGGTFAPAASAPSLAFSGGSVAAGRSCTLSVAVQALRAGTLENVSGGLTSDLPVAAPPRASATLTVNPAAAPGFAKAFSPATVDPGGVSTLTFTIDNGANLIDVGGLAFTDAFPEGMVVAGTPNGSTTCGGTFAPAASAPELAFSGGSVAAAGTCTLSVDVRALVAGTLTGTSGELTSDLPVAAPGASATLTVNPAAAPGFAKAFSPARVDPGGVSTLTFTIDNGANLIDVGGLAFTDAFPDGMVVAGTPNGSTTCGGTFAPAASAPSLAFSGGSVAAGRSCTLSVAVQALRAGTLENVSGELTSDLPVAAPPRASATLTVNPAAAPGFAKAFSPARVDPGGVSTLTFTIDNEANAIAVGSLAFTDAFPDGMVVAGPPNAVTTCGGTFAPAASATSLAFSGGSVAAGGTCTLSVDVRALVAGTLTGTSGELTSDLPVAAPGASATLEVNAAPLSVSLSFEPTEIGAGGVSRLTYGLVNGAAVEATSVALSDTLPDNVVLADPSNAQTTCTGGTLTAAAGGSEVSWSGGSLAAGADCTIAVNVTSTVAGSYANGLESATSSLGTSAAAEATLTVEAAVAPGFAKAFSPVRVDPGGVSTLTFTINNEANAIAVGSLAFTDAFPEGLAVAGTPDAATTCGGTFAPAASATSLDFSGGSVAAGQSCTLSVDVRALVAGTLTGTSGELTSDLPVAAPGASATLEVNAAPLSVSLSFEPTEIGAGGVSRLTYGLDNGAAVEATSVALSDTLPDNVVLAPELNADNSCGGTLTAAAGGSEVSWSGGSLAAGADCTIAVDVTSTVAGSYTNGPESATSSLGTSAAAEATLTVEAAVAPGFAKAFSPATVDPGRVSTLTFTIDNEANAIAVGSLAFTDAFPEGLAVSVLPNGSTTCGGTFAPAASATSLDFSGGSVAAGQSCTLSVDVRALVAGTLTGTSGELTSDLPVAAPGASATLEVNAAPLSVSLSFEPTEIGAGGVSRLTYGLDNGAAVAATSVALSDRLPDNVVLAPELNADNSCGGTLTAAAGGSEVSWSGGSLAAGADCTIAVDVTSTVAGSYTNGPESATSSLGTSTPAEATLTVEAAAAPGFAKAFSPDTVDPGRVSTLTFTIDNEANAIAVGSLAFTDAFPDGMVVAGTPNGSTTCGGTFAPAASAPELAFSGGSVAAAGTCTLSVDVRALVAGTLTGTSGELTSDLPVAAPGASATLEVNEAPLSVSLSFEPTEIGAGGVSRLTYGLVNGAAVAATSVALSDTLPDNVVLADPSNAQTTCTGGTLTAAAGGSEVSWSGGSLAAGADCTIAVDVTSAAAGSYTNGPESATSSLGTSTPAEATLTVEAAVAPGFAKAFSPATVDPGGVSTLTFTIDNGANLIDVGGLAFTDAFPEGMVVAGTPNGSTTCGGTFAPAASAPELAFSGGSVAAAGTCTLSVDVRALVAGTLTGTSGELTSDLPVAAPGASATLEVNEAPLSVSLSFEPTEIGAGGVSRLTYGLVNGAAVAATSVALSDTLPDNVVLADPSNAQTTCTGGTLTAAAGGSEVSWSGGSLAAGADCTIAVDVTSAAAGSYTNGLESATSSLGTSTPAEATLTVEAAVAPGFAKAFSPATVDPGGVSTLTFTIDNGANLIDVGGLAFTDAFPEGLAVAGTPDAATTCGGTFAPAASATSLDFSGGSVAAGQSCTLSVDVRALVAGTLTGTSGELTSDLPVAAPAASATLEVNAAPLSVSLSFEPTEIGAGGVSRLTYGLDNGAAVEATSVALSDRLPDNVVLAPELNADNSCGGTLTAAAGGSEVSWSGGSLAAGADCTIAVDVTSTVAGSYTNGPESATSSLGTSTPAEATLTVEAAVAPGFAKAFSPATVDPGGVSTLTFTIDNGANLIDVGGLAFTDAFPEGLAVSVLPNGSTTCGGTFAPAASATSLDFSGGSVAAAGTCTLSVDVRALVAGTLTGTSGELTSDLPVAAPGASATLTVNEVPLSVSMSFSPSTIGQGGVSRLTYGLDNGAAVEATSVALSDRLPDNVVLAGVPNAQTTCTGGTLTAAAGGSEVSWSGGSLAAGAACTIAVDVTSAVAGSYPNGTESATSSLGTSAAAEAMLTVDAAGAGTVTLDVESDTDGIFSFSSAEPVLTLSLEVKGGAGSTGALAVATGSYSVAVAAPTGVALTAIACDDTDSTADVSAAMISVTVDASEAVTCTLTAQSSVQPTVEAINSFLTRRTDLILSSESDPRRRFERLNRGSGQASPVRYSKGDLKALVPFTVQGGISFTERQDGNGSFKVSTSLLQARQAAASAALASGPAGDVAYVENYRFGAWLEAQYKQFGGDADKHGDFAIAYFGMDYLVKPDVLVGALVSLDTMEEVTDTSKVSGFGYMFGPYMTARLTSNLYFDGHVAIGRSDNRVSPFNTYTDTFQTRRWLARASLTGEARHGNWTIQPHVRLAYFEERQQRYVDSVGATIPRQTVRLGQLKIGPTFTGRFEGPEGWSYAPYLGVEGIYNIGDTTGVTLTDTSGPEVEGWRARLKAGVGLTAEQGTRLSLGASHDGLGRSDFENWGLNFELSIPFGKPAR